MGVATQLQFAPAESSQTGINSVERDENKAFSTAVKVCHLQYAVKLSFGEWGSGH